MGCLQVVRAGVGDLSDIYKLEQECFSSPWPIEIIYEDLCANRSQYFLLKDGSAAVGYAGILMILDEVHINKICVSPKYRGMGYGKYLMLGILDSARHSGADSLTLEVRRSNSAAISMYVDFGFQVEGIRKHYYEDTGEDALIMWKKGIAMEMEQQA